MVQRKVPSKLGIQADQVKSEKRLANLKLSYSQHQDGKSRGADMKKKMKKSRSIKLSDLEALQSPLPSRRCSSQPGKPPPPLHVPTTTASASPQKQQPLVRTIDGSPNYMKPTSSSHAKKELLPVSLRNTPSGSNFENLPRKFSSDSKPSCASSKKSAKNLTRSSSMSLVRSLTKTTSFKASRACPKKSARAALCADMSAPQRATCSSTLKDSKFPPYLMLNPAGTESEGTSVMKVCPYAYCSLNGHRHADLPPLKSFMSARRRLLMTQKSMRLEALSPRRLKVPGDTEKDPEIEQNAFEAKATNVEIGMDIFIEIYAKEREAKPTGAYQMGKIDFVKEIEDQQDIQSTIEESGTAAGEDGVKQVAPIITDAPSTPKYEIDLKDDFKKSFCDVAVEVDTKGIFLHEQNAEADEGNQPRWSHEEISMGSHCSVDSYDGEHMKDVEMDDSDSKATEMEWEEQQRLCGFGHEEDVDSSVFSEDDSDSKVESLSESSRDVSVTWLDDILSSYNEDILAEETLQEANAEESKFFEEQHGISSVLEGTSGITEIQETGYPSKNLGCNQSFLTEVSLECFTKAEDNDEENEKQVDDEPSCDVKVLDEETIDNSQCQKMSEICSVGEASEDRCSIPDNNDESSNEENKVHMLDVSEDGGTMAVQEQELLEKDQGKANKFQNTKCLSSEEQNTSKNWKCASRRKRPVEDDDDEMRKFNPREPNFLRLVPEPEPEKVDLRHQMMDERKNADEWMLDCALRQVVTKLAPARKKKVALLVEAFETVMPIPKCEAHMRKSSAFPHARRIQACS